MCDSKEKLMEELKRWVSDNSNCRLQKNDQGDIDKIIYDINIDSDYIDSSIIRDILIEPKKCLNEYKNYILRFEDGYIDEAYSFTWDLINEYLKGNSGGYSTDEVFHEFMDAFVKFNFITKSIDNTMIDLVMFTDFHNESNTDFTSNSFYMGDEEYTSTLTPGGITWLVESQGYKMEDVYTYREKGILINNSKFIESVVDELNNTMNSTNMLTFLVPIEMRDAVNIVGGNASIVISKDVKCGLYNPWLGAGSLFEIYLEKEVVIPRENIRSLNVDGFEGYSISDVYGDGMFE